MTTDFYEGVDEAEPTLSELLDATILCAIAKAKSATPGRVLKYDASTQRANVQAVVNRFYDNGDEVQQSISVNVPVVHYRAGGFFIHAAPKKGDECVLVFSGEPLDEWKARGGANAITPKRKKDRFNQSDCFALMGATPLTETINFANSDCLVLGQDNPGGLRVEIGGGKIKIGTPAAELVEEIENAVSELQTITIALNAFALSGASWVTVANVAASAATLTASLTTPLVNLTAILAKIASLRKS